MKTVIEMAREAGAVFPADGSYHNFEFEGSLERFAALVRADEREQGQKWFDAVTARHKQEILAEREVCAKYAENYDLGTLEGHAIAAAIRARGQA